MFDYSSKTVVIFTKLKLLFTSALEAKLVSIKHFDSSAFGILKSLCRKHGLTLVDKVYLLSISLFIRILEPLHLPIVHTASISYWSSMFSSVVKTILGGLLGGEPRLRPL